MNEVIDERLSIEFGDGVADVKLVRGDKMNALDQRMFEAIAEAGRRLEALPGLRCVVLSGEGKAFCAGLDVSGFASMAGAGNAAGGESVDSSALAPRTHGKANLPQYAAWMWRELPVPVIAAVHGVAYGGGFQVALGADLRFVTAATRMSVMEIKWGLVPDMAGTQLMRHLCRDDVVRELTYTGRVFDGEEALALGLATRVCADPHAEAMEVAAAIASRNPDAIRADKRLLNESRYLDAEPGLVLESELQDDIIGSPNQVEAVMAELEKRPAKYR